MKRLILYSILGLGIGLYIVACDPVNNWDNRQDDYSDTALSVKNLGDEPGKLNPVRNMCDNMQEAWIFCDDFESDEPLENRYFEYTGRSTFTLEEGEGRAGGSAMRARFRQGYVGAGGLKKSFGRTPDNYIGNNAAEPDKDFHEIYWRFDLRLEDDWVGGGGHKLVRATTMAASNWSQGTIAHLWSAGENHHYLGMDPASGIDEEGNLVSTRYNDFPNLRWLGFKAGSTPMFGPEYIGEWVSIEARVKLNTPGESDGIFEFWINDELQAGSYDLNWHGTWNEDPENFKLNAIFLENHWDGGAPATQDRYFDNFIISTERIGPGLPGMPRASHPIK